MATFNDGILVYNLDASSVSVSGYIGSPLTVNIPATVDISGTTYNVTSIGGNAFRECQSLTSVTFDPSSNLTSIDNAAFFTCSSLTSITIPNSVTSIGAYAFFSCNSLTSVTVTITDYAKWQMVLNSQIKVYQLITGGTTIDIINILLANITVITEGLFIFCRNLTSITIPKGVTSIGGNAFRECQSLTSITIPNSVTSIDNAAFYFCSSLTSITIPNSVTSIGAYAFFSCDSLTSVYFLGNIPTIDSGNFTYPNNTAYYYQNSENVERLIPFFTNIVPMTAPISNICFPSKTPIVTNQGIIHIDKINPEIHTIRNKKIVAITKTVSQDKYLICFEKDALGINMPSQKTIITQNHEILYNGKMIKAKDFLQNFENVKKVKYSGEVLYNVLMEEHNKMVVNNLICETLNPENGIAKLQILLQKLNPEQQEKIVEEYNNYAIKNNIFAPKKLTK